MDDVKWLGFRWTNLCHASDYFDRFYEWAIDLIKAGKAYVDDQSPEEIRAARGTLTQGGVESPYRDRSPEENLDLFERMEKGEFDEGSRVLRAKIDMASSNINMRDPVMYRILKRDHYRTGDKWCIYPLYDFAHPIQDAIEDITHSLCSLEYEDHRPLYDWVIENTDVMSKPRQIEFGRRSLDYTVMSKRHMRRLVEEKHVIGWDDPRMPTLRGLRRRGYTPESIRDFCKRIGVGKTSNSIEYALLEHCLREDLNKNAQRAMAVLRPVKLLITNYPEDKTELFKIENNPEDESAGFREVLFSRELWIESEDFMVDPPKKYNRLFIGNEVRLKGAYVVKCTGYETDENNEVTLVTAEYDPETRGGSTPDGRKVRGTIHWVDTLTAIDAEIRIYDNLFTDPDPAGGGKDFTAFLNPNSLITLRGCKVEKMLESVKAPADFQFLRLGYFAVDNKDSSPGKLVFNRAVALKDGFKK
jgi:glutaminyl-tRNA synthetase